MSSTASDTELKARHRAMWASGDYPSMVETSSCCWRGPRLVEACEIGPGMRVLDVAAGTGNARGSILAQWRPKRGASGWWSTDELNRRDLPKTVNPGARGEARWSAASPLPSCSKPGASGQRRKG